MNESRLRPKWAKKRTSHSTRSGVCHMERFTAVLSVVLGLFLIGSVSAQVVAPPSRRRGAEAY
jgi:hypothetical protein